MFTSSVSVNKSFLLCLCQLLDEPQFRCITKIKTIGSTYMAASGVTPDVSNGYSYMKVSYSFIVVIFIFSSSHSPLLTAIVLLVFFLLLSVFLLRLLYPGFTVCVCGIK